MCSSKGDMLVLLRTSMNNHNTWGLPGGNLELQDQNLLTTAVREAGEEIGTLPDYKVVGQVCMNRECGQNVQRAEQKLCTAYSNIHSVGHGCP
jgi:8-oxo-dGTP pyrophosphatase MutT (NUDIX family)